MGAVESVLYIFGILLIVTIVAVLIRIYYIVQQQGIQISILLKHEKEGFVLHNRWQQANAWSRYGPNQIVPPEKAFVPKVGPWVNSNTRAQQPCQALTTDQLKEYSITTTSGGGLDANTDVANKLGVDTVTALSSGAGAIQGTDFQTDTLTSDANQAATDQKPDATAYTGNGRTTAAALIKSGTPGVKAANSNSSERFRAQRRAARNNV